MALHREVIGDVAVVIPEGMLKGDRETTELENSLRKLMQDGQKKILLDLQKTAWLNSIAIGMLTGVHTSAMNRGVKFAVCNVERRIHDTLVILRLLNVLNVYDKREEALEALAKD